MVQDRTKDTRGVEAREAEPIDGAVHSHERNRVHISDYAVVRHRLISHSQNPHPSKVEIIIALNFGRQPSATLAPFASDRRTICPYAARTNIGAARRVAATPANVRHSLACRSERITSILKLGLLI